MKDKHTLLDIKTNILNSINKVFAEIKPDFVLIYGNKTMVFVKASVCFDLHISVGHVREALHTNNIYSPYHE